MYSNQIEKALKSLPETSEIFRGVYASDRLPKKKFSIKEKHAFVINLCEAKIKNSKQCHWVFLYFCKQYKNKKVAPIEYYCSSGTASFFASKHLINFIQRQKREIRYLNVQQQGLKSSTCGYFVCLYAFAKANNLSMRAIKELFDFNNLEVNDKIVKEMFKCIFKKKHGTWCFKEHEGDKNFLDPRLFCNYKSEKM